MLANIWERVRDRIIVVLPMILAAAANPALAEAADLARFQFGTGWATFGLVLPSGAARGAVKVGPYQTQTDVKTVWPDGSIRFAIVTARITAGGEHVISSSTPPGGSFSPSLPSASVRLVTGGASYVADLLNGTDLGTWLSGSNVLERRFLVTPMAGGSPHPFLRVLYDIRSYNGGGHRVDVTVQNTLDIASANEATYDVTVVVEGATVFSRTAVNHKYLARWRRVFLAGGLTEASVVTDFAPFHQAKAIPRFLSTINKSYGAPEGSGFDILTVGSLSPSMAASGGRHEIAPYPNWAAQFVVHRTADLKAYTLKMAELAATWAIHITEPDGHTPISIDTHPNYWLDPRGDPGSRPANGMAGVGQYRAENAHQPSLAYIPYLVTGDRFYLDEVKFWANFCLLWTWQEADSNKRQGSRGILEPNQVRGIGWALRNITDAAAYAPDSDPMKAYFTAKVNNNLAWLDDYASTFDSGPVKSLWPDKRPENRDRPPYIWVSPWEQYYSAWAVDHATDQGFTLGRTYRDRVAQFCLRLFTSSPDYPIVNSTPYLIAVGTRDASGAQTFYTSMRQLQAEYARPTGYYGPESRLMLQIAEAQGMPRATAALAYLMNYVGSDGSTMPADLNRRSGWAIDRSGSGATTTAAAQRPSPPKNVRIIRR